MGKSIHRTTFESITASGLSYGVGLDHAKVDAKVMEVVNRVKDLIINLVIQQLIEVVDRVIIVANDGEKVFITSEISTEDQTWFPDCIIPVDVLINHDSKTFSTNLS